MFNQMVVIMCALFLIGVGVVRAQEKEIPPVSEQVVVDGPESMVTQVGNKICPVSGEKIGEMGEVVKIEHNGKIYNLCCSMCQKDFMKDPEKYSKIAEDEAAQSASENK